MSTNADCLRIEFNDAEKDASLGSVAVEFRVINGNLRISEDWGKQEELWGSGCRVFISPRIWREALPWIQARISGAPT